ncbi:ribosome recycling factor [Candidatus Curtissbacteria bacterium]|nr:ribosome recycling factor [Candidatus Curtissbacteria bacterium]
MDLNDVRQKMADAVVRLKAELTQIRTGRANSSLVSDLIVDAYDSKMMVKALEKFKVQIRQVRHEFVEQVKKQKTEGDVSEDDAVRRQEDIQKLHDEFIEAIDVAGKAKEEELRQV